MCTLGTDHTHIHQHNAKVRCYSSQAPRQLQPGSQHNGIPALQSRGQGVSPPGSSKHDHGFWGSQIWGSIIQTWSVPRSPSANPSGRESFYPNRNLHIKAEWVSDECQPLPGLLGVMSSSPGYPQADRRQSHLFAWMSSQGPLSTPHPQQIMV